MPNDSRLDDKTNIYEDMKKKGRKPWELSFLDPRLEGDDFAAKDKMDQQMHAAFKNSLDNKFAHLDQESKANNDLGAQFTCFTSTKVQILTQKRYAASLW